MARLITIPISHYCERARWALEHAGIPYREEQHLQIFHYRSVRAAGGGRTVPVFVADSGEVVVDSADIVAYADAAAADRRLYPTHPGGRAEVEALEREFAGPLGVEARRVMYFHFFRWGRRALRFNAGVAPRWERWAAFVAWDLAARHGRRLLDVNTKTMLAGVDTVERIFDAVATRLSDGRPYLTGDAFTAADLTFACMAAPVTVPERYGTRLPRPAEVPAGARAMLEHFREHPAGAFALRLSLERPVPAQPSPRAAITC